MGIFSKKEDNKKVEEKEVTKKVTTTSKTQKTEVTTKKENVKSVATINQPIIKNPRITEKAAGISDNNTYTFDVYPRATKTEIVKAVKKIYNVTPIRVNVLAIPKKPVMRFNISGVKQGGRKAYVTLKKGDKIEFI